MKRFASLSFKNRLTISYSLILVLMLIGAAFFYHASYRRIERELDRQTITGVSSSIRQIDHMLEQVHAAGIRLSSSTRFKALSDSTGTDKASFSYAAYQMQDELRYILPSELMVENGDFFIYMENSGYVFSSTFFSELKLLEKAGSEYTELARFAASKELMKPENWRRFIPLTSNQGYTDGYLYVCPINSSLLAIGEDVKSVLCLRLDAYALTSLFDELAGSGEYGVYAMNTEGRDTLSLTGTEGLSLAEPQSLSQLSYDQGSAAFHEGAARMSAFSVSSDYNSWAYYFVQPASSAYSSAGGYQKLALGIVGLTVLLELGFILLLSAYNSKPVARLHDELENQAALATTLTTMVEKSRPLVSESYTRRLMEGSITTNEQMAQIAEEMGLNREGVHFQVFYAEVSPRHASRLSAEDLKLCIQNYDILVREALNRYFPDTGYIYKPRDAVFACLVAAPSALSTEEATQHSIQLFFELHNELAKRYEIEITAGFGSCCEIVSYIWRSYQEAKDAQSLTSSERCAASYYELAASSDVYYFPESLAVQLGGFISTGSSHQVEEVFRQLKEENFHKRLLSHTQLRWLIADVRGTIFRKRRSMDRDLADTPEKKERLDLIDRQFEGEIGLDTLESIALQLCSFYDSDSDSNELIIRIQDYINRNYGDPSLSLSKISEEFHISENYFSFLFKKEVSENFSTYLEKLRMAKAKELVMESTTSISELYQYVGYNNAASFRRVFKKNFGVSPREMRDKAASGKG